MFDLWKTKDTKEGILKARKHKSKFDSRKPNSLRLFLLTKPLSQAPARPECPLVKPRPDCSGQTLRPGTVNVWHGALQHWLLRDLRLLSGLQALAEVTRTGWLRHHPATCHGDLTICNRTCWPALASIVLSASHGFYLEVNIGGMTDVYYMKE